MRSRLFDPSLHGQDGPVTIRRQAREEWPAFTRAVCDAAKALSFAEIADINGAFVDGIYRVPISATETERMSAARAYLTHDVRARPNLSILAETECRELIVENGAVRGARGLGRSGTIIVRAKHTVLTAGAIKSPWLLLASGIGPAAELKQAGVVPRHDLPGVGRNLQNHVGVTIGVHLTPDQRPIPLSRSAAFIAIRASSGLGPASDLYLSVLNRTSWTYFGGRIGAINAVIHKPYSHGKVRLARTGSDFTATTEFSFLSDPRDAPRLAKAVEMAAALVEDRDVSGLTRRSGVLRPDGFVRRITTRTTANRLADILARYAVTAVPADRGSSGRRRHAVRAGGAAGGSPPCRTAGALSSMRRGFSIPSAPAGWEAWMTRRRSSPPPANCMVCRGSPSPTRLSCPPSRARTPIFRR